MGKIGGLVTALVGLADLITKPFRIAFNAIADLWNNTIGALILHVPGVDPGPGRQPDRRPRHPPVLYVRGAHDRDATGVGRLRRRPPGHLVSPQRRPHGRPHRSRSADGIPWPVIPPPAPGTALGADLVHVTLALPRAKDVLG